jgi:hypothetical protein
MANPTWFQPTQQDLTYEEAGIQTQAEAAPGKYWVTPDGTMLIVPTYHNDFAKQFLGGEDNAYSAGCVRVGFDESLSMYCQAQDCPAFNNPALELLARIPSMVAAETMQDRGILASFTVKKFVASAFRFGDYVQYVIDKQKVTGCLHLMAASSIDRSKVIEEQLTVDHLTITFHDKLFDYYLAVPNMPPGWYITEIGGMKVGFGSKYQLKKFMLKLKEEFFSDGQIPGSNIKIAPIPEIEEPIVRRMGSEVVFPEGYFDPEEAALISQQLFQKAYEDLVPEEAEEVLKAVRNRYVAASVPIIEHGIPLEVKKKLEKGSVGPQLWEISEGNEDSNKALNGRPTGPML